MQLCRFSTLIHIVPETAIASFRTLPVGSLILDHGVPFIISVSGLKSLNSYILLDTSFHQCLQSVIIRSCFLRMNLQVIQFQYGLGFLRLSFLNLYNPAKMSSDGILVIVNKIPSHPIPNRVPEYHHFEEQQ